MSRTASQLASIAALLRQETTLALATVNERGEPCVAPLFYIADANLTLYWLSSAASLHSLNLARNPRVSATVYRHAETWKQIRGLQMRGQVAAITQPERRKALIGQYRERFQLGSVFRLAISQCSLYAFRPECFRYLDNSKRFGHRFELIPTQNDWERFRAATAHLGERSASSLLERPASLEAEKTSDGSED
jgi:uncharacterized protein YhbP (UPF0306 family)